jgi:hypothetical protein
MLRLLLIASATFCVAACAPTCTFFGKLTGEVPSANVTAAVCARRGKTVDAASTSNTATGKKFRYRLGFEENSAVRIRPATLRLMATFQSALTGKIYV